MINRSKILVVISMLLICDLATAQTKEEGPWWPHPIWGAEDQAGGSNWITPEKVLESLSAIKTGKVYELGFPYHRGMPLLMGRTYAMFIPGTPFQGPFPGTAEYQKRQPEFMRELLKKYDESLNVVSNDDFLCTEIGQVGTQLDSLAHIGKRMTMADGSVQDVFYNGFTLEEMKSPYELKKLGVENVKPFLTRGILIDIAGYKEVETLADSYVVTLEDVRKALKKQSIEESSIRPGDAILFNFGWWRLIDDNRKRYTSLQMPGIDPKVAQWVIEKKPSLIGSDATLDYPGSMNVHMEVLMKNGIFNLEFMTFDELLTDEVDEFAFIFTPTRFKGATGSPGRPIAIH